MARKTDVGGDELSQRWADELKAIFGSDLEGGPKAEFDAALDAALGEEAAKDPAGLYKLVHGQATSGKIAPLQALCLSGGGIRSASFVLGVMQGLARTGKLDRFHYVSTVSGGGYIGSWLSALIQPNDSQARP